MRDLGADEIVGWSFADPGSRERLRLPEGDPRRRLVELSNPLSASSRRCARRCSAACSTPPGSTWPGATEPVTPVRVRAGSTSVGGATHEVGVAGTTARPSTSRTGSRCSPAGAAPPSWRGESARAGLLHRQGPARGAVRRSSGRRWRSSPPRSPSCIPGAQRGDLLAGDRAGWIGEVHPLVARSWDLEGAVGVRARPGRAGRGIHRRPRALRGRDHLPARARGHRRRRSGGRARAERARGRARGRRRAAALRRGLRPLHRASRSGRAARASRCASSSARPTGR